MMTTYNFTGFENADLFGHGSIKSHATFVLPAGPTLEITLEDDDPRLSGDARANEYGDDFSGQTGRLTRVADGEAVGIEGRIYAERIWNVTDSEGNHYKLVEVEQPGHLPDSFTFFGQVPPAGAVLTVGHPANVSGAGLAYDHLGAGEIAAPAPNIVDIAAGSDDFNILVKALQTAGLDGVVRDATDITVFAPTDAAFTQLALDLGFEGDESDEDAVFGFIAEALAGLAPDGDPIPLLQNVLTYHVSPGEKTAAEVDAADEITTLLAGATFGSEGSELVDNEPDIANPNIVLPDLEAANGTIQVIDRVLLPIDIPGNTPAPTLTGLVAASGGAFDDNAGDFDLLLNAVQAAGLAGALDAAGADLTVFAPTDGAFVGLSQTLGFEGSDEGEAFAYLVEALALLNGGDAIPLLKTVLLYHVAPGTLDDAAVLGSSEIATLLGGASLGVDGVTLVDADPDVPNPMLIDTNLEASNGIAHVLDGVLLPADLLQSDGSNDVDFLIKGDGADRVHTGRDNDLVDGNGGNDRIYLGSGDDVGLGGAGHDRISGGRGDDTLLGNEGRDVITGGRGDDMITGGAGRDLMIGGKGADTFIFNEGDGHDVIRWFESGHDKIDLSGVPIADVDHFLASIDTWVFGAKVQISDEQSIHIQGWHVELDESDFIFDTSTDTLMV
ncbi:MAG: fasciclin domain-containing protein [Silicimonas sp.]|nr:fasciclin domain-containing protein [Silicimonas sp.]